MAFIYNIKKNLNVSEENITKYNNSDKIKFKLNNYNILVNEISVMNFDKINEGDIKFVATFVKNILSLGQ